MLPELASLERRRKQLVARSDAYRQALVLEYDTIQAQTAGARRMLDMARKAAPIVSTIGSLFALLPAARGRGVLARKGSRLARWAARWQLASTVHSLVRGFTANGR